MFLARTAKPNVNMGPYGKTGCVPLGWWVLYSLNMIILGKRETPFEKQWEGTVETACYNCTTQGLLSFFFPFYYQTANDFFKNLVIVRKRRKRGAICKFPFFNCFQFSLKSRFIRNPTLKSVLKNFKTVRKQKSKNFSLTGVPYKKGGGFGRNLGIDFCA